MQITHVAEGQTVLPSKRRSLHVVLLNYLEVVKPLPTALLGFIGVCTAFIAAGGQFSLKLILVLGAVIIASAGANGLTNYLDRDIDKRMQRTCLRVLPSGAISPSKKVLPMIIGLIIIGLGMAWLLHPYVFVADAAGTLVAATWRKKVTCVYPQGVLASCAPIIMGWLAVSRSLNWELMLLCFLIAAWLPLHVWSVNITHRDDYRRAGLNYFPVNLEVKDSVKVLLVFSVFLYLVSLALYIIGGFGWLYLVVANILGIFTIISAIKLVVSRAAKDSWRLYRLSAFPYLGVMFLVMCLDVRFFR
jgi:protoheme IX farnesyltransferase